MAAVPVYLSILFAIAFASLNVQGDDQHNSIQPEITIVTAPHHVTAEKRSPLLLNCTVRTTPDFGPLEYEWRKNGLSLKQELLERRVEIFSNGSLYFRRIVHRKRKQNRSSDEGLYECIVGNERGRVIARRVHVEVAGIARNFTQEPVQVEAFVGGAARFECSIQATPPADIVWMKENSQLPTATDNYRLVQLPTGALQIHDVQETDAGMYRCMAAQNFNNLPDEVEDIKWKWSRQAALTVSAFSGRRAGRLLVTAQNITAMEGEDVTMECMADGNPKPRISWQYKGRAGETSDKLPLPKSAEMFGRGNLRILKVMKENEGVYHCSVNMGSKTLHIPFFLQVQTPPLVTAAPESNRWPLARVVTLDCAVQGSPKPKVSWFFNGTPIDFAGFPRSGYEVTDKGELFLFNVELSNTGYYQCLAENAIGQVIAVARLEVFAHKDAPQQPYNLTARAVDSTTLELSWNQAKPVEPILTYVIHAHATEVDHEKQMFKQWSPGIRQKFNLTELQPYTSYAITVRAYNAKGASSLSDMVQARTMEGVPTATPTFEVSCPKANTLLVKWDEMPLKERGGRIAQYRLEYHPVSQPDPITTLTINGTQQSFLIEGLEPNARYKLRLLAATQKGYPDPTVSGGWSEHVTCEKDAPLPPPALKVDSLNTTAVLVHWDILNIKSIELRRLDSSQQAPTSISINPPAASYVLGGLDNNTDYEVTVHASTDDIQVSHTFRISEGLLVPIPTDIDTELLGPTSIQLRWRPSVELEETAEYEVCYSKRSEPASKLGTCLVSDKPVVVVEGLQPFTAYRFLVRINLGDRQGTFTNITAETSEDKPGPPVNLTYEVLRRGSIRLQWSPPNQPNGVITQYVIFYNVQKDVPDMQWKNLTTSAGEQTAAEVDDLDVQQYYFKMVACNRAGRGNPSEVVLVYPDCSHDSSCKAEGVSGPKKLSDKNIGIIVGVCIGVTCIIICIVVILCRHRCFRAAWASSKHHHSDSTQVYHGNGHLPTGHGNSHSPRQVPAADPVLGLEMRALETMPMLNRLPENEQSDAKGGGDMIVTPNGVRMNGFVKTNGQLSNGHVPHGHLDLSGTSEERHSLIAAMLAATNGNPAGDSSDTALTASDAHLDQDCDSLNCIDHSDTEMNKEDGSVDVVLAGNLATCGRYSTDVAAAPETCIRTGQEGDIVPLRDKPWTHAGGACVGSLAPCVGVAASPQQQQQQPQAGQGAACVRHNGVEGCGDGGDDGSQDCEGHGQRSHHHQHSPPPAVPNPGHAPHLRKPAPSSPLAQSSSLQTHATSQHRSPGHRYLASDLPPPPPPPPPPSPPPSPPPPTDSVDGVERLEGGGCGGSVEVGGQAPGGGSHREGGVTFTPQPSLPQSTAASHQAAAAAAPPAPALASAAVRPVTAASAGPRQLGPTPSRWDSNPHC